MKLVGLCVCACGGGLLVWATVYAGITRAMRAAKVPTVHGGNPQVDVVMRRIFPTIGLAIAIFGALLMLF